MALSGIAGGEKTGWNSTTGAPMDGMARLAKEWFLTPDGRFTGDKGPIELGVGVVDAGETGWGREKGRKRARVEVINKAGGIKVDLVSIWIPDRTPFSVKDSRWFRTKGSRWSGLKCPNRVLVEYSRWNHASSVDEQIEVDEDRQVDLRVEAKAGDILVLL